MNSSTQSLCTSVIRPLLIVLVVFSGSPAAAETGYVTDMLQLDLYADESMSGKAVRKLRSGDSFEILSRKGRTANVRLPGGQTGWVKSLYIVNDEPARTRLNKLEDENKSLAARVETLQAEVAEKQGRIDALEGDEDSMAGQLVAAQDELAVLREENAGLENSLSSYGSSVPLSWLLLGTLLALGLGAFGGWYFVDSRSRAKHGGYRVY